MKPIKFFACRNCSPPLRVKAFQFFCMQSKIRVVFPFLVIPAIKSLNCGGFLREKLKRGREKTAPIKLCLGPRFSKQNLYAYEVFPSKVRPTSHPAGCSPFLTRANDWMLHIVCKSYEYCRVYSSALVVPTEARQ